MRHQYEISTECMRPVDSLDENQRRNLATLARKSGGITLRNQELKLHTNGVKFLINRSYISDGVLDPDSKYMLVIIPEPKDVHFDGKDKMKFEPVETDLMACLHAIARFYGFTYSLPMLFGGSAHAFMLNVHQDVVTASGAYSWNMERIFPLLSNLGLKIGTLGKFQSGSAPADREAIESVLRKGIDRGIPQLVINASCQIPLGYSDHCFYMEPVKLHSGYLAYPEQITTGTWDEFVEDLPVMFFSVEKGMVGDERTILADAIRAAIDMRESPARWTKPPFVTGYEAIGTLKRFYLENSPRLELLVKEHPFVERDRELWAENRMMASNFMGEVSSSPAFNEKTKEIAETLQKTFRQISRQLKIPMQPYFENYDKALRAEQDSVGDMKRMLDIID